MPRYARLLFVFAVLTLTAGNPRAQVATSVPQFGSFGGGPDTVNLANLNVHLDKYVAV